MSLDRLFRLCRLVVPLVLASATATLWLTSDRFGVPVVLAALAGALLGLAVVLTVEGVLMLAGILRPAVSVTGRRLQQLERDKASVLQAIKEIDLDASIHGLGAEETAALSAELRDRAIRILRQLDRARIEQPLTVTEQIERELARRLGQKGET